MVTDSAVSGSERRQALNAVLTSQTFARSAQLRAFLGYICERKLAGHPEELTEYQIAVNVLGRGKEYNLSDDSAVRNRAYELRQRLEKYYGQEQPDAEIRIEIPRGNYVPCFTRRTVIPAASAPVVELSTAPSSRLTAGKARSVYRNWLVAEAIVIVGLCVAFGLSYFSHRSPDLVEAWGPLARPDQDLLISVATNLHMIVRPHISPERMRFPAPPELYSIYGSTRPLSPDSELFMQPAQLSVPFAEMIAATKLCAVRSSFGGSYQILPEAEAPITALRDRNSILIGSGTNSQAAAILLSALPWSIDYIEGDRIGLLDHRTGRSGRPPDKIQNLAEASRNPVSGVQYSLLTVIRSRAADGKTVQTVVLSGVGSAGIQSAVELFCSPDRLAEMLARFAQAGLKGFPPVYQIVLRCRTAGMRLISFEYAGHVAGPNEQAVR